MCLSHDALSLAPTVGALKTYVSWGLDVYIWVFVRHWLSLVACLPLLMVSFLFFFWESIVIVVYSLCSLIRLILTPWLCFIAI